MSQSLTIQTVESELVDLGPQLAALLPPDVPLDRFRSVVLAAIRQKPALLQCNRQSLFNACLNAAQDGLMPDGREGAIVPRKGQAVWQPMVGGIIKRVKTSGSVATLSANAVYEGETFDVLLGDEDRIVHRREIDRVIEGREVAYYAIATLKDGSKEREVMTLDQIEKVRQSSSSPNDGPWVTWPAQMALKTVIRRLAKRLPVLDPADEALHRTINRVDSLYDFGNAPPERPVPTIEPPPQRAATPRGARVAERAPTGNGNGHPATRTKEQWEAWLEKLRLGLGAVRTRAEVVEIGGKSTVGDALATAPDWVARDISAALADAYGRFPDEPETAADPGDHPDGGPRVAGEQYAGAG